MGTAGRSTRAALVVRTVTAPSSLTLPQAWHSPQRPTHLTVVQPHSEQRNPLVLVDVFAAMADNLRAGTDSDRHPPGQPLGQADSATFFSPSSMPCQFCENCSAWAASVHPSWVSVTVVTPSEDDSS